MKKFVCVFLLVVLGGCAGKNRIISSTEDFGTIVMDFGTPPDMRMDIGMDSHDFGPPVIEGKPKLCSKTATQVDILFVVDNSATMTQEQLQLRENFPKFIEALRSEKLGPEPGKEALCTSKNNKSGCKIPDVHIGVISTDLGSGDYRVPSCEQINGDGGKLQNIPKKAGCKLPSDPWISYSNGTTNIIGETGNPIDQIKDAFSCIAELGTNGCGYEQTLEAARWALDSEKNVNPGFLRKGALLVVVFVTDEDDCSASNTSLYDPASQDLNDLWGPLTSFRCFEFGVLCDGQPVDRYKTGLLQNCVPGLDYLYNVEDYISFFAGLDSGGGVILTAIAGPIEDNNGNSLVSVTKMDGNPTLAPSCSHPYSGSAKADPAIRIKKVIEPFEAVSMGFFYNICDGNMLSGLDQLISSCLGN